MNAPAPDMLPDTSPSTDRPAASAFRPDRRFLLVVLAAVLITGLVVWRQHQDRLRKERTLATGPVQLRVMAPDFALPNHRGGQTKLSAYLGRTRLVLYFTGGTAETGGAVPLNEDQILAILIRLQPQMAREGIQTLVITPAGPQQVQAYEKSQPSEAGFLFLSDLDLNRGLMTPAHTAWGLVNGPGEVPRPGLFLIDRAGRVVASSRTAQPLPEEAPLETLKQLEQGHWP